MQYTLAHLHQSIHLDAFENHVALDESTQPPFIATLNVQEKSIAGNRAFVSLDGALSTLHHFPILIQVDATALQIGARSSEILMLS